MPLNPTYIALDADIQENKVVMILNQSNFNSDNMVFTTLFFYFLGIKWDAFLLWFKTLAAVQMYLSADTQALNSKCIFQCNNIWHLFLTIYTDEHLSWETFFMEISFSLCFLKVFSFTNLLGLDTSNSKVVFSHFS